MLLPFLPQSPQAQDITNIFIITLAIAGVIFLIVTGSVIYASIRFRQKKPGEEGQLIYGNRKLEITWTVVPALILVVLAALTLKTMVNAAPPVPAGQTPDVIIIGHQWWWEFQYPKLGVTTANELHIPTGTRLLAEVRSADVIHSFWVPQLGPKIDATPGFPTNTWLQASMPGTFQGTCVEYCGAQHANMRIMVIAQTESDFNSWVQQQQVVPALPTGGDAALGAQLFATLTCSNCHTIAGTDAQGTIAPNLTHVADRQTLGAGVIPNSAAYLASWLADPQAIKPESLMPNLNLTTDQINELVAYLEGNK